MYQGTKDELGQVVAEQNSAGMPGNATQASRNKWRDAAAEQVVVRKKPKKRLKIKARRRKRREEFSVLARLFAAQ